MSKIAAIPVSLRSICYIYSHAASYGEVASPEHWITISDIPKPETLYHRVSGMTSMQGICHQGNKHGHRQMQDNINTELLFFCINTSGHRFF